MKSFFKDRSDGGRQVSQKLLRFQDRPDVVVLGIPRGGVPVAYEIARILRLPLDVFIVRKLGVPNNEELAFGAIASRDILVLNERVYQMVPEQEVAQVIEKESKELDRRNLLYRGEKSYPIVADKIVILVDDGLATGASMKVAVKALRHLSPMRIIVAVPVAFPEASKMLKEFADEVIWVATPESCYVGIGQAYDDFSQISDQEVIAFLQQLEEYKRE